VQDVNRLLKQFAEMRKMMKAMTSGKARWGIWRRCSVAEDLFNSKHEIRISKSELDVLRA